jgi:hypothetical protein
VRRIHVTRKTAQIAREMKNYHLDILGFNESRWTRSGKIEISSGETIIYSGGTDNNHSSGVAIVMTNEAAIALLILEWSTVSDRIISAQFLSKHSHHASVRSNKRCTG